MHSTMFRPGSRAVPSTAHARMLLVHSVPLLAYLSVSLAFLVSLAVCPLIVVKQHAHNTSETLNETPFGRLNVSAID